MPAWDGIQWKRISWFSSAWICMIIWLIICMLSAGGNFWRACSALRESVNILIFSRAAGLHIQCSSAVSMPFNSAAMELTLLVILVCIPKGATAQTTSLIHTAAAPAFHSVESPSMVDPQWDIWYWGSQRNLHTVCWSAVGCEWGTTSVYFGITYVCLIPSRLPVFAVEPQYLLQDFLFLSKVSFEGHIQNLQKISCWFKTWMRFVGPILIKLWTSCFWGFP